MLIVRWVHLLRYRSHLTTHGHLQQSCMAIFPFWSATFRCFRLFTNQFIDYESKLLLFSRPHQRTTAHITYKGINDTILKKLYARHYNLIPKYSVSASSVTRDVLLISYTWFDVWFIPIRRTRGYYDGWYTQVRIYSLFRGIWSHPIILRWIRAPSVPSLVHGFFASVV